jgi:hypothetical protein
MSENESEKKDYTAPAITRRETLETLGTTGAGAGLLAGSSFPGEGRGPPGVSVDGEGFNHGEEQGEGPPAESNGRGRGPPDGGEEND